MTPLLLSLLFWLVIPAGNLLLFLLVLLFLYHPKIVILSEVARALCELRSRRTPKSSICRYKSSHFNLQTLAASHNMRIGRKGLTCRGNIKTLGVLRLRVPKSWDATLRMTVLR
jgi:hypothetical protein